MESRAGIGASGSNDCIRRVSKGRGSGNEETTSLKVKICEWVRKNKGLRNQAECIYKKGVSSFGCVCGWRMSNKNWVV